MSTTSHFVASAYEYYDTKYMDQLEINFYQYNKTSSWHTVQNLTQY